MHTHTQFKRHLGSAFISVLAVGLFMGCQSSKEPSSSTPPALVATPSAAAAPAPAQPKPATAAPATASKAAPGVIRIRAGETTPLTDSGGNVWLADQGFSDGETTLRAGDLKIENTRDPGLYRAERYNMTAFSYPLPNGKYTVKLHFAETYEDISGPGQRVFSFNVEGHEFKDFDVWVKAGGGQRAYIETVNVDIGDGKLDIQFVPKVQNPEINGIEIIPGGA